MRFPDDPEAQAYADAIMDAIERVAMQHGRGNMGAVLGAITDVQSHFIAGVADRKHRKALEKQVSEMMRALVAEYVRNRTGADAQTIVKEGPLQ